MVDRKSAQQMRDEGMSCAEIGKVFGVSRQRINQILKKGITYTRKHNLDIEEIPYAGLYEWMSRNPQITYQSLARILYSSSDAAKSAMAHRFASGTNCTVSKHGIDRLLLVTGMSYEQLFALRKGFEEDGTRSIT